MPTPAANPYVHAPPADEAFPHARWVLLVGVPLFVAITAVCGGLVAASTGHPPDWAANLVGATSWALFAVLSPLVVSVRRSAAPWQRKAAVLAAWAAAGAVYLGAGTPVPSLSMAVVQLPNHLVMMFTAVGTGFAIRFVAGYHGRQLALAELRTRLTEAQLRSLKLQLHPHFLYNALHSISALIRTDLAGAEAMLAGLRELFVGALRHSDRLLVPLADEIQLVRTYLGVEQVRFGDRLAVEMHVDPALRGARVPPLLLQPLVENALRHGLAPRAGDVRLRVQVRALREGLEMVVEDDGVGLPHGWSMESAGVGLSNIRDRLRHLYGDAARMTVADAPAGGTRVTVLLGAPQPAGARPQRSVDAEPASVRTATYAGLPSAVAPRLTMRRDGMLPRVPVSWWAAFTGFWVLLVPFTAWLRQVSWHFAGYPGAPGVAWLRAVYSSVYCFALGLACFAVAHALPPGRGATRRRVLLGAAMSAVAGPVFGFGQAGLNRMLVWGLPPASGATRLLGPMTLWQNVLLNVPSCVALTWQFLAIGYALEFHRDLRAQARSLAEAQGELQQAELRLLRARLHPEFLFAAFDSIAQLMRADARRAHRLISLVGDFLRASLRHSTRDSIPLREEVALLALYLSVRQARAVQDVAVESALQPRVGDVPVPHLLLPPLADHLLRDPGDEGAGHTIRIEAELSQGVLTVAMRIDGTSPDARSAPPASLAGLRARLERTYGGRFSIAMGDDGRSVEVAIPAASTASEPALV